jgi:hypothetical protein
MYTIDSLSEQVINSLSDAERDQLYNILVNNTGLMLKLMPNLPLLLHISGQDRNIAHPVIANFEAWKTNQSQA